MKSSYITYVQWFQLCLFKLSRDCLFSESGQPLCRMYTFVTDSLFWSLTASLLWKNKYHTFWQASLCVRALSVWIDQQKNSLSLCVAGNLTKLWKWKPGGVWGPYSKAKKGFYLHDMFKMSHPLTVGTVTSDPLTRKSRSFSKISY